MIYQNPYTTSSVTFYAHLTSSCITWQAPLSHPSTQSRSHKRQSRRSPLSVPSMIDFRFESLVDALSPPPRLSLSLGHPPSARPCTALLGWIDRSACAPRISNARVRVISNLVLGMGKLLWISDEEAMESDISFRLRGALREHLV